MRLTEEEYTKITGKPAPPATSSLLQIMPGDLPQKMQPRDKFRRAPKEARTRDGILFDSLKEANDYNLLKLREQAGEIRNLRMQVPYALTLKGRDFGRYDADFVYEELCQSVETGLVFWSLVVADSKPDFSEFTKKQKQAYEARPAVRLSRLKRGLAEMIHHITIVEI